MKMSSFSILSLFLSFFLLPLVSAHQWDKFHNLTGSGLGDRNPAIVDLKQYLHDFGYLRVHPYNYTDYFDKELLVGLRRYQHYFNLEVTGVIDSPTTRLLTTPRCGVRDIVTSLEGKLHYSFFRGTPKLPMTGGDLIYAFVSGYSGIDNGNLSQIMSQAFLRWGRGVVTPFRFLETDPKFYKDITIGFYSGDHGEKGYPFDGRLGIWGHASPPPVDMKLHFDADEIWSPDLSTATSQDALDLDSVAMHEIGHLLGLAHSSYSDAIMYPYLSPMTRKVDISEDDIQGIHVLYGWGLRTE